MAKEEPPICTTFETQIAIKNVLTKCRQCEEKRKKNNITAQLQEILGQNTDEINKIIKFLKWVWIVQINLEYKKIVNKKLLMYITSNQKNVKKMYSF